MSDINKNEEEHRHPQAQSEQVYNRVCFIPFEAPKGKKNPVFEHDGF